MTAQADPATKDRKEGANGGSAIPARTYLLLVIALVALVCLSIAIILAYGSDSLSTGQVWFLSGFLVLFSVAGVATVTWLLIRHSRQLAFGETDRKIEWKTTSPEKQKRKLNAEVRELASLLGIDASHIGDIRAAYIVAEDLALRRVQNESGSPLMRKVSFGAADFDAVFTSGRLVTCTSVLFLVRPDVPQEKINRLLREAAIAKNVITDIREGSKVRLLLILVTQLDSKDEARLRSSVADQFKSTPVDVDIRWMDFQKLQELYSDE